MGLFDTLGLNGDPQAGPGGWTTQTQYDPLGAFGYNVQNDPATRGLTNSAFSQLKNAFAPKSSGQLMQSSSPQAQPVGAIQVNSGKPLLDPQMGGMNAGGALRPLGYSGY